MDKKKSQHRGSVETLALSGNGDTRFIIAEIRHLVNTYEPQYEKNVLPRIKHILKGDTE